MKVIAEFLGTALLVILGNGAVAIVHLKGSKGFASGWIAIASGYGIGVIAPGDDVPPDFRPDQSGRDDRIGGLGTANHGPSFRHTSPPNCWGQWSASWPSSSPTSRTTTRPRNYRTCSARSPPSTPRGSRANGFATEFLGTLVLALAALVIPHGPSFAGAPGARAIGVGFLSGSGRRPPRSERSCSEPRPRPRAAHRARPLSVETQGQLAVVVFVGTGGGADRRDIGRGRDVHLAAGLRVRCGYRAAGETPAVQRSACPGLQPVALGPFGAGTSMARNPSMLAALRCRQYSGKKASS